MKIKFAVLLLAALPLLNVYKEGKILPVKITFEGVEARKLKR